MRAALGPLADRIRSAFVYGSVAKRADHVVSDIDLMVIAGKLDYADVFSALQTVEAELGRTVNPNVMTLAEWRRKQKQAGFVSRIASQPRLFVIGSEDDLAYNAAHALALRRAGYRSNNRYLVFQALEHTVGMAMEKWRILAKAHERRNLAEYEGHMENDDRLLAELIATANELRNAVT